MDITEFNDAHEKNAKYFRNLKESYMNKILNKEVLTEGKAKDVAKQLRKKQSIQEAGLPEDPTADETNPTPPPIDVTAPEGAPTPVEGEVPPVPPVDAVTEPVDAGSEIAPTPFEDEQPPLEANPEQQMKLQGFIGTDLANAIATVTPENVSDKGILVADLGANNSTGESYTMLVFPKSAKLGSVYATLKNDPQFSPTGAQVQDAITNAENPETSSTETQVEPTTVDAGSDIGATESPEEEKEENIEQKLEESRDPTMVGKKDWKKMLQKLLNESVAAKEMLTEETEDEINKKIENLEAKVKNSSGEEKEAAEEALAAVKSRKAKMKGKEAADKGKQKPLSAEEKEKVEKTED